MHSYYQNRISKITMQWGQTFMRSQCSNCINTFAHNSSICRKSKSQQCQLKLEATSEVFDSMVKCAMVLEVESSKQFSYNGRILGIYNATTNSHWSLCTRQALHYDQSFVPGQKSLQFLVHILG